MSDITSVSSPFDSKRREGADGEYWLARELFRLLGYKNWERFAVAIERAMISVAAAGDTVEHHFRPSSKDPLPGTPGSPSLDYRLTRYAAYMIAMNGDVRKPEIAHAQAYFAIKTREAEIAPIAVVDKWADHPDVLATKRWLETNERVTRVEITLDEYGREIKRVETTTTEKVTGIEERVQNLESELAPKVKAWEHLVDDAGLIELAVAAQALKFTPPGRKAKGRTTFNEWLRGIGWLAHQEAGFEGTRPTQWAVDRGLMDGRKPWIPGLRKRLPQAFLTPKGYEHLEEIVRKLSD